MPSDEPKTHDPVEVRALAVQVAAGILSNPQAGNFDAAISQNEVENIADLSVRVAKAIIDKVPSGS